MSVVSWAVLQTGAWLKEFSCTTVIYEQFIASECLFGALSSWFVLMIIIAFFL